MCRRQIYDLRHAGCDDGELPGVDVGRAGAGPFGCGEVGRCLGNGDPAFGDEHLHLRGTQLHEKSRAYGADLDAECADHERARGIFGDLEIGFAAGKVHAPQGAGKIDGERRIAAQLDFGSVRQYLPGWNRNRDAAGVGPACAANEGRLPKCHGEQGDRTGRRGEAQATAAA